MSHGFSAGDKIVFWPRGKAPTHRHRKIRRLPKGVKKDRSYYVTSVTVAGFAIKTASGEVISLTLGSDEEAT